jgi:hypothetical protein
MQKTLTTSPMRGAVGDPGAPTINVKTSTTGPLGGGARDPGASTINAKNIDDSPPGRRYQRSGRAHDEL